MSQFYISTPCEADASHMTPSKHGSFCTHCQKEVIDFTHTSEEEILAFLQSQSGSTCGKLRASQLSHSTKSPRKFYPGAGTLGRWMRVLPLTLPTVLAAQSVEMSPIQQESQPVIQLKLVNALSQRPIQQAEIALMGKEQRFFTDYEGICLIPKADVEGNAEIRLRISHNEFEGKTLVLPQSMGNEPLQISMKSVIPIKALKGIAWNYVAEKGIPYATVMIHRKTEEGETLLLTTTADEKGAFILYSDALPLTQGSFEGCILETQAPSFETRKIPIVMPHNSGESVMDLGKIEASELVYTGGISVYSTKRGLQHIRQKPIPLTGIRGFFYRVGTPYRWLRYKMMRKS